jgi:hypothetical protein
VAEVQDACWRKFSCRKTNLLQKIILLNKINP